MIRRQDLDTPSEGFAKAAKKFINGRTDAVKRNFLLGDLGVLAAKYFFTHS